MPAMFRNEEWVVSRSKYIEEDDDDDDYTLGGFIVDDDVGGKRRKSQTGLLLSAEGNVPVYPVLQRNCVFEYLMTHHAAQKHRRDLLLSKALAIFCGENSTATDVDVSRVHRGHLAELFQAYDEVYFESSLSPLLKKRLQFATSWKLKEIAGTCEKKGSSFLLTISLSVLSQCLTQAEETRVHGILCRSKVAALCCVFEHEMLHAILEGLAHRSHSLGAGGHTLAFLNLSRLLFGHTSVRHELTVGDLKVYRQEQQKAKRKEGKLRESLEPDEVLEFEVPRNAKSFAIETWRRVSGSSTATNRMRVLKVNPKSIRVLITHGQFKKEDIVVPLCYLLDKRG